MITDYDVKSLCSTFSVLHCKWLLFVDDKQELVCRCTFDALRRFEFEFYQSIHSIAQTDKETLHRACATRSYDVRISRS